MKDLDRNTSGHERMLRQAGAWRSLLAPYYTDSRRGAPHLTLTPEEAVATATALLTRAAAKEPPWSVLERRLAEAQQSMRS